MTKGDGLAVQYELGSSRYMRLVLSIALFCLACDGPSLFACQNELLAEYASPTGAVKAVVFQRDCGATTGFSTQVSILPVSDPLPNEGGNTLVVDSYHGAIPAGPGGGPEVRVRWDGPSALTLSYSSGVRVFAALPEVAGIRVSHEPL
jgi:hypothetical protein